LENKKKIFKISIVVSFLILLSIDAASADTYTNVSLYKHHPISGTANWGNGQDTLGNLFTNIFYLSFDNTFRQDITKHNSISGTTELGKILYNSFRRFYTNILYTSHDNRIREDGYIQYVNFDCESTSQLSEYYIDIWRKNGNNFSLVYMSKNLVPQLKIGSNAIWLNDTIPIKEGDYVGETFRGSGSLGHAFYAPSYGTFQYFYGLEKLNTSYTRDYSLFIHSPVEMMHPIEIGMKSPDVVFIGDSIIAGHPGHYSFIEKRPLTNLNSSCEFYFGKFSGLSYQNMGIGGQTTSQIRARFQYDVVNQHPKYAVIEGGVNDVGKASNETIIENWDSMLLDCVNNNIQPIVILILPGIYGNSTQTAQVNYINKQLLILAKKYNAIVVDSRSKLGVYNKQEDSWIIKPEYNVDNVHFNSLGYAIFGHEIANAIMPLQSKVISISTK
jgi:lysophospholipase L1-like esterase